MLRDLLLFLFQELPNNGVMLVYVSGDGCPGNAKTGEDGEHNNFHLPLIIPPHDSELCMFYKFVVPQWSASRTKSSRTYIFVFFIYRKIPGISPGPIQLRKGFRVGL